MNNNNNNMDTLRIIITTTTAVFLTIGSSSAAPSSYLQNCFSENSLSSPSYTNFVLDQSIDFSLDLFKALFNSPATLQNKQQNIIFSPLSIWSTLMTTYFAASGQTASQLSQVLGLGNDDMMDKQAKINAYFDFKNKYKSLKSTNITIRMANKIYIDDSANNERTGLCMDKLFKSEIERLNIAQNPDYVRQLINGWVEAQTNCKIRDFMEPGMLTSTTRMVIANAAYFKGLWQYPFLDRYTKRSNFFIHPTIKTPVEVDMMFQEETIPFTPTSSLDCAAIELPYGGHNFSMVLLLPQTTLEDLVPKLTKETLNQLYNQMSPTVVRVSIPKFKSEETIQLREALTTLGIRDLFDSSLVDLSGFTGEKGNPVHSVLHKAFIEVNEEGTEAAAATAVITAYSLRHYDAFLADRPFLYLIRNNADNTIVFMGALRKP